MDRSQTIEILNELLAAEQACLAGHLLRSTLVASRVAIAELETVRRVEREGQEHGAWLVELIGALDGTPGLRVADTRTAGLHYRDLHHALPLLVGNCTALVDLYARAGERVADQPQALALVNRIRARHEQHVQSLQALLCEAKPAASS